MSTETTMPTDADQHEQGDDVALPLGAPAAAGPPITFGATRRVKTEVTFSDGGLNYLDRADLGSAEAREKFIKGLLKAAKAANPPVTIDGEAVRAMLVNRAMQAAPTSAAAGPGAAYDGEVLRNYEAIVVEAGEGQPGTVRRALTIDEIAARVEELVPGKFNRIDDQVFFASKDNKPVYVDRRAQLFSALAAVALVEWDHGGGFVSQDEFLEHLRREAPNYRAIETMPHEPPMEGVYYMHQPLPPPGGKLEGLVARFLPATELDRDLIRGFMASPFWGGRPGDRPAWLITGLEDDPDHGIGVGKTKLADVVAEDLGGGSVDVSPTSEMADTKTRLLSSSARQLRFARLDNVKSLKFAWADLEGLITSSEISGKQLYKGEGRRPNTLSWVITLNAGNFGKDMAKRANTIKLARPAYDPNWEKDTRAYAANHRWEIIADIVDILKKEVKPIVAKTRWASWEAEVLARVTDDVAGCQDILAARQGEIDSDDGEQGDVRDYFERRLRAHNRNPATCHVLLSSLQAAEWLSDAMRKPFATNQASTQLAKLGIAELKKSRTAALRGWIWRGPECTVAATAVPEVLGVLTRPNAWGGGSPMGPAAQGRKLAFRVAGEGATGGRDD